MADHETWARVREGLDEARVPVAVHYQYRTTAGHKFGVPFVAGRLCIYCEQAITGLSTSGPLVCGSCACGNGPMDYAKAWRNIDAVSRGPDAVPWEQLEKLCT